MPFCNDMVRDFELSGPLRSVRHQGHGGDVASAGDADRARRAAPRRQRHRRRDRRGRAARRRRADADRHRRRLLRRCCMRRGEGDVIALNGSGWAPAAASLDGLLAPRHHGDPDRERARRHGARRGRVLGAACRRPRHHGARGIAAACHRSGRTRLSGHRTRGARLGQAGRKIAWQCGCCRDLPAKWRTAAPWRNSSPAGAREGAAQHRQRRPGRVLPRLDRTRHGRNAARRLGGLHTLDDFSSYAPEYVTPIRASYRGYRCVGMPAQRARPRPARHVEGAGRLRCVALGTALSVERLHALTEIGRQAYADRDCFIGDPRIGAIPVDALAVGPTRGENAPARVVRTARHDGFAPMLVPEHRDTTFVAVVDSERNTVAFINSIFDDFGSGIVSPKSGVIFHNRACGFVLEREPSERDCRPQAAAQHHHPRDADAQRPGR